MADGRQGGSVPYRDYITLNGRVLTPDGVRAEFELLRKQCMDLPLEVSPIAHESERALNPHRLGEQERYAMDVSYYDLDNPTADGRIKNEFQYYEHVLRGLANNQSVLLQRKRNIFHQHSDIEMLADRLYSEMKETKGDSVMGKSETARRAWFDQRFPALREIRALYKAMLAEMEIEKERLNILTTAMSRNLTATQDDYQVRGMMGGVRIAGHNE